VMRANFTPSRMTLLPFSQFKTGPAAVDQTKPTDGKSLISAAIKDVGRLAGAPSKFESGNSWVDCGRGRFYRVRKRSHAVMSARRLSKKSVRR
jgi:hypothetical protein